MGGTHHGGAIAHVSYWPSRVLVLRILTLFMLVSALMGLDVMKSAYGHAVCKDYRFYSYGDASFLLPVSPRG